MTIAIAAYNVENYLKSTLDSLLTLDGLAVEVIVVNDGSSDSTKLIIDEYCKSYPNLFLQINKNNGGWGSTLNAAFKIARGKYIKQLDGDDLFDSQNLIDFVNYLKNCNSDLVVTPYNTFRNFPNEQNHCCEFRELYNATKISDRIEDLLTHYPYLQMHAACFKTEIIQKNKILISEHCFYTDVEYMVKAIIHCSTMSYFDKTIYLYRLGRNGQSVSVSGMKKHFKDHQFVLFNLLDILSNLNKNSIIKEVIKKRISIMAIANYDYLLCANATEKTRTLLEDFDNRLKNYNEVYLISNSTKIK